MRLLPARESILLSLADLIEAVTESRRDPVGRQGSMSEKRVVAHL
jgi:hypothetical protein